MSGFLALMNAGIKGSQAGTALRTIMNNLTGEIKLSGKALGDVTIATTNADGSMRDLSDILADCRGAFSQLSESLFLSFRNRSRPLQRKPWWARTPCPASSR